MSQKASVGRVALTFVLCTTEGVFERTTWELLEKLELSAKRKSKGPCLGLWFSQGVHLGKDEFSPFLGKD